MKIRHTLIASALLTALSAQAQTSITVYGNADIAYNNLLWKKDEMHIFYREGIPFNAKVKCVDEQGCLHMINEQNQELTIVHGAVQWF